MFLGCFIIKKNFCWFVFHLALSFEPFIFSYQYNVRMREQPEAVGPSEERARRGVAKKTLEGKQPTKGLTSKQMKESEKQHTIV